MKPRPENFSPVPIAPSEVDRAAARMQATIASTCEPAAPFPEQLQATLRAALALLAAQPDLLCLLTDPTGSRWASERQFAWRESVAAALRTAAERGGGLLGPEPLTELLLIAGAQSQLRRALYEGEGDRIAERLPGLHQFILAYYPKPASNPRQVEGGP
jgi:hypothetical protein